MYNYDYRWLHRRAVNYLPLADQVNSITFYREPKNVFQMFIAGATHALGGWDLDHRVAYSSADKTYPATFQVSTGFNGVQLGVDRTDPNFPLFSVTNGFDLTDPSALRLRNMQITQAPRSEYEYAVETNAGRDLSLGGYSAHLRAGLRATFKDAEQAQPD